MPGQCGSSSRQGFIRPPGAAQRVACVAQCLDAVQRFELLAQAADHDVHGARVQLGLVAAQLVEDVVAREHAAALARQQMQQVEFGAGQFHIAAQALHAAAGAASMRRPPNPSRSSGASAGLLASAAAQHGLQAGHQLARLEGLGQVVVGAEFQAHHAVHHRRAR